MDLRSASAVSAVVAVTFVASFVGVSAGVGGWGFSASCCSHPGAPMGWDPSDCRSP